MFSLASGIYQTYLTPTKLSLMVIGLEGTGKTTLLERFKVTNFTTSTNKSRNSGFTSKCFGPRPVDQDEDEIENLNSQPQEDYDLKPGAKMMPANRIQRTVGMNLAKMDICKCRCQFWDIGGSMKNLWERYYPDSDAVILVVDMNDLDDLILQEILTQVEDHIPILIFGNRKPSVGPEEQSAKKKTMGLPPQFAAAESSFRMKFVEGSAKTGEGVKAAMEWLIPFAKRQQQLHG